MSNNVIFKVKCSITSNDSNDCRYVILLSFIIFSHNAIFLGNYIPSRSSNTRTRDAQSQHKLKCFSYVRLMRNEVALSHSMAIIMLRKYFADKREQENWWSAILSLGCTHDSNRIMTGNRKISRSHYIITAISLTKILFARCLIYFR